MSIFKKKSFFNNYIIDIEDSILVCKINKKVEIDISSLNIIASDVDSMFCKCCYSQDNEYHIFKYDISNFMWLDGWISDFDNEKSARLFNAIFDLIEYCEINNMNIALILNDPQQVWVDENFKIKFIYLPIISSKQKSYARFISKLLSTFKSESKDIFVFLKEIFGYDNLMCMECLQKYAEDPRFAIKNINQKYINNIDNKIFEESETSILNGNSNKKDEYISVVDCINVVDEGITTILGTSDDRISDIVYCENEETTFLNNEENKSIIVEDGVTEYIENEVLSRTDYYKISENNKSNNLLDDENNKTTIILDNNEINDIYDNYDGETTVLDAICTEKTERYLVKISSGEMFRLNKSEIRIGSMFELVDICIANPSISRVHAKIYLENDECYISDENSTNGTYVEGVKIQPKQKTYLFDGSLITLGNEYFQLIYKIG